MGRKREFRWLLASCLIAGGVGADPSRVAAASATLPSRTAVLSTLNLVADYARRQYPANTEAYWDHGVYHIGMMALYDITRRSDALAYTTAFGDYNGWMLDRGGTANLHNRLAAGQSWIAAHAATPRAAIDDTRTEVAAQTAASLAAVTSAAAKGVSNSSALITFCVPGDTDLRVHGFATLSG